MADHTGGPWTMHFNPLWCEIIGWEDGEGIPVAQCAATMTTHGITPWKANAFIITAAPEMLEVLEMVQADNLATQQGGWCYLDETTIEALAAIIAKAKGESNES